MRIPLKIQQSSIRIAITPENPKLDPRAIPSIRMALNSEALKTLSPSPALLPSVRVDLNPKTLNPLSPKRSTNPEYSKCKKKHAGDQQ